MSDDDRTKRPTTAVGETLREIADAEKPETPRKRAEERRHEGEGADAITPNTEAQRESQGD
ncbi:hypothetical protein [Streptomyces sp. NRRL F-2799]|uniref:hypothetical protein n=1 Tax=Streptomyces sp. NRRL F-2799 TaxID=1463844 RepID=UPI0004C8C4DA|nr:hypothetical protein [Streptomyces sp. NRRL F-2799]